MNSLRRRCPICDCGTGAFLHHQTFASSNQHLLGSAYDVVCCTECGFAFADTAVTQEQYDHYYQTQSKYADSATSTGAGLTSWDSARLRDTAAAVRQFTSDSSQRIVDIGCANGGLLAALRDNGFDALFGVDPSSRCVQEVQRIAGVQAYSGSLVDWPGELPECNGVLLSHVIEHVRDLRPALSLVHERLSSGGWVYIEVPDATRYQDFVFAPFQDFNTEHINHFSLPSLANLLRRCGFEPVHSASKTIYSAVDMPYPAIFAFAKKSNAPSAVAKDEKLAPALVRYIEKSSELMRQIDERIRQIVAGSPRLYVWGAGQLTLKLLAETSLAGAEVEAFVDGNPASQGRVLQGAPILAPQNLPDPSLPILIGSIINKAAILDDIKRLGLKNPVLTLTADPEI